MRTMEDSTATIEGNADYYQDSPTKKNDMNHIQYN